MELSEAAVSLKAGNSILYMFSWYLVSTMITVMPDKRVSLKLCRAKEPVCVVYRLEGRVKK
jgi:hypothetical protein